MKKKLPQEGLKLLACGTMLLDHWALLFEKNLWFRAVGRLAFPLYCFLIAEGIAHTGSRKKYFLRLLFMAVLSEPIYDFALYPGASVWLHQNVIWTLLLGALLLDRMEKTGHPAGRLLWLAGFAVGAELLRVSYGGWGILMIALFGLTRGREKALLAQSLGLALVGLAMGSIPIEICGLEVPVQLFWVCAMVPIALYSGEKATKSRALSWGFYLFYPVHLLLLGILP